MFYKVGEYYTVMLRERGRTSSSVCRLEGFDPPLLMLSCGPEKFIVDTSSETFLSAEPISRVAAR